MFNNGVFVNERQRSFSHLNSSLNGASSIVNFREKSRESRERERARWRGTVFPTEIRCIIFEFMERSLFMEMLTTFAAMVRSYKIALFFFPHPPHSLLYSGENPKRSLKFYYQIGLFTFQKILTLRTVVVKNHSSNRRHRGPRSGISNSNFPAIELAGKRAV